VRSYPEDEKELPLDEGVNEKLKPLLPVVEEPSVLLPLAKDPKLKVDV
jgi:hypothetical protein